MSGECDKCGEHATDCECSYEVMFHLTKGVFYLNGDTSDNSIDNLIILDNLPPPR